MVQFRTIWHHTDLPISSEELIRELCVRVLAAQGADFTVALADLQAALKTHVKSLRAMAAATLLKPKVPPPTDPPQV